MDKGEIASPAETNLRMAGLISARFRRVMRPLAIGTALCVALSAPLADFLLEHHDMVRRAHFQAIEMSDGLGRLTSVEDALQEVKRFQGSPDAEEIARAEIFDPRGRSAAQSQVAGPRHSWPLVRGEAPLVMGGRTIGTLVVTLGESEWLDRDLLLLSVFGSLAIVLGLVLYLFPLRLFREEDIVRLFAWRSIKAAEEERLRLSRDLHDGVGQSLGTAAVAMARLSSRIGATEETEECNRLLDNALEEVRRVAGGLRPPALSDLGLGAAVEGLAREAAGTGLHVSVDVSGLPPVDPDVEQTCFRLAQEALANVVRHAHARSVRVLLAAVSNSLVLEVQDDGRGFSPVRRQGLGLVGARERAARLSGSLEIRSTRGRGTLLRAVLPLRAVP